MKTLVIAIGLALISTAVGSSEHVLQGPYDYDEHARPQPRFFTLDDKPYHSADQLKLAIAQLPPGSRVHWAGSCQEETAIELPPRPYMSLSAFRSFCRKHHVDFTWYFGR
jgi:hypothetical protein